MIMVERVQSVTPVLQYIFYFAVWKSGILRYYLQESYESDL